MTKQVLQRTDFNLTNIHEVQRKEARNLIIRNNVDNQTASEFDSTLLWNQRQWPDSATVGSLLHNKAEQKIGRGGHNEKVYFLTTDCFKAFCMTASSRLTARLNEKRLSLIYQQGFTVYMVDWRAPTNNDSDGSGDGYGDAAV
jgi:hypothetical protein